MAERTDKFLIETITDATIQSLDGYKPSVASWEGRIYRIGLNNSFPHGPRVRGQLADLRLVDPDLILARSQQEPPFVIFGAQWRHVVEQFDSEDLSSALLQLYRHDLYPDRLARTGAFQNATRALTALAARLTARLSSSAIETIIANMPVGDIAPNSAEAQKHFVELIGRWHEAAHNPEQREALALGVASNATVPRLGRLADLEKGFFPFAVTSADETVRARISARRASLAATYLSIGISEEPRVEENAALERLAIDNAYWIWITLGPPVPAGLGIDTQPIRPEALAGIDEVEVVLFADKDLALAPDPPIMTFRSDGVSNFIPVTPGLSEMPFGSADSSRAWIRLQAPGRAGTWYVRCGVFVKGVLVHVETLTVAVGSSQDICSHRTTFRTLSDGGGGQLNLLTTPTLTMYANQSGSSIDLSFYSPPRNERDRPVVAHGSVPAGLTLEKLQSVRSRLSQLSYGSTKPYTKGRGACYQWSPTKERFISKQMNLDIRTIAKGGRIVWGALWEALEQRQSERDRLQDYMRRPGKVEIALKSDATYVLPAQVFYDHPLDTTVSPSKLKLCNESDRWLGQPTSELACLTAGCAEFEDRRRVCLSGFWGFRHAVSTRLSAAPDCEPWPVTELTQHERLMLDHAISTEQDIQNDWPRHSGELRKHALLREITIGPDDGSVDWVKALGGGEPPGHLLYFLTHMEIGEEGQIISFNRQDGPNLDTNTIIDARLQLCGGRPLVFLNGCESAGQNPLTLLNLIDSFLKRGASGAVGTEVTVFLDTATHFAEAFIAAFDHACLGESMRLARWELLRKGSPLGLIYLSFGLVDLRTPAAPTLKNSLRRMRGSPTPGPVGSQIYT